MGKFVNPDNKAFEVALYSEIYIDKTEFLTYTNKVMNTKQAWICNSRPRRFGKSITVDMLVAYYSRGCDSEKIFKNLKIGSHIDFKKHLNQYDVICVDVQWFLMPSKPIETVVKRLEENVIEELKEYDSEILQNPSFGLQQVHMNPFFHLSIWTLMVYALQLFKCFLVHILQ